VEASPAQPAESTATPATSLSENIPSGTAAAEVKEKESPPPALKQPNASVSPTWSVVVSTDPYPSIRIPEDISSQKPSLGRSLQIGRAISRVEPVYPEDAKRQGIEGTVKLHVVVGGDGSIESVELASGPALLAKAATSAIREWRYGQTLLGGQTRRNRTRCRGQVSAGGSVKLQELNGEASDAAGYPKRPSNRCAVAIPLDI